MTPYQTIVQALLDAGGIDPGDESLAFASSKASVRCPAHEDTRESLSVAEGDDGRALVYCFAGCPITEIVAALGLEMGDLFAERGGKPIVAEYVYTDEEGRPLLRVLRTYPKGFSQERWDPKSETWRARLLTTRRVPYQLPAVLVADTVWLVEGEKDAERLGREGIAATTLLGGAGNWREEYAPYFRGRKVNIVADRDDPNPKTGREAGQDGAMKVKNALRGIAKSVDVWIPPAPYKDVTLVLEAGLGLRDLERFTTTSDDLFAPEDWETYKAEDTQWLFEPYVPKASRVLVFGAAGSLKSLFAMYLGVNLAREGHKVAYFSLEMRPHETAKRLRRMNPPTDRFKWYSRFSFTSPTQLAAACELLKGYSLIVIDSWSAAAVQMELRDSNQAVAKLDSEVFAPLIDETGAALLILDNTGHGMMTEKGAVASEWARGASAKGDKMDLTLFFQRPSDQDNATVDIKVKKMRGDRRMPPIVRIATDPSKQDDIDFTVLDRKTGAPIGPLWTYFGEPEAYEIPEDERPLGILDQLRLARDGAKLGSVVVSENGTRDPRESAGPSDDAGVPRPEAGAGGEADLAAAGDSPAPEEQVGAGDSA